MSGTITTMSQRGTRQNRFDNDDPPPTKRRKGRPPTKSLAATGLNSHSGTTTKIGSGGGTTGVNGGGSNNSKQNLNGNNNDVYNNATASTSTAKNTNSHSASTSSVWQARSLSDLKLSSIYNRSAPEPPAELFRKDLISAMKLPDSEPLAADEYWVITDQWKQEWERGVQVPVSPDSLPEPVILEKLQESYYIGRQDFKL